MFSGQIAFEPTALSSKGLDASMGSAQVCTVQLSDRLYLRSLTWRDADQLFALIEANRAYLRQWLPWLDENQTANDSREFIRVNLQRASDNNGFSNAICYDQQLVGLVSLNSIDWYSRISSMGYWLAAPLQGNGIVTSACKGVIAYGFGTLNLNRIEIRCATENFRSQAIAQRLGLTYEGTLRDAEWLYDHFVDHHVYSILNHEWPQS